MNHIQFFNKTYVLLKNIIAMIEFLSSKGTYTLSAIKNSNICAQFMHKFINQVGILQILLIHMEYTQNYLLIVYT